MRFHVLGVSHSKTSKEFSADAFSQKARLICKMLTNMGHTVYHYGTEGSDPVCTENVSVLSDEIYRETHDYDWKTAYFNDKYDTKANLTFVANAIEEVKKRIQPLDFILCTYGLNHKPICDGVGKGIVVESGIGYEHTFAPFRVFESYAWMSLIYGKQGKLLNPNMYDSVIPNYYDLSDYEISSEPKTRDYFFMVARPTALKGWEIAERAAETTPYPLITAGQGHPGTRGEHLGAISIETRLKYMSNARAVFVPTIYFEPFGGVVVEALLSGTPVITTDFGAFPEIVLHGKVGYRCRTLEQFSWAANNISDINPITCREYAKNKYSLERVALKYDEYFNMLQRLHTSPKGWYDLTSTRTGMAWLNDR